jgi:ribonuclease HI
MTTYKAYTDGSFKNDIVGWGFVIVDDEGDLIHQEKGRVVGEATSMRNVAGELSAVMHAVKWAKMNDCQITIYHDLEGAQKWADGEWKRNNKFTQAYYDYMKNKKDYIASFVKVLAHSGIEYNEMADELASQACC